MEIFTDIVFDRDPVGAADVGLTLPDLDNLVLGARAGQSEAMNLLIDDIYLSKDGFLDTVPRPFGFSEPSEAECDTQPPVMGISATEGGIEVTWDKGTLESATSVSGPWEAMPEATSPYQATADGAEMYFRARQ